jgi:hypothetical protein
MAGSLAIHPGASMHTSGKNIFKSKAAKIREGFLFAVMLSAVATLLGCGGAATPISPSSGANPAPGVTLQKIQITPSTALISLAEQRQLIAIGVYSDGTTSDITSQVSWAASSAPSTTNYVAVNSSGVATGMAIGATNITATLGPAVGIIQLTVDTNGYTSTTAGILSVPFRSTVVDAAYLPQSQTTIQGTYAVQEVNLDADQFSNVLPVPVALIASIPMPAGFVPSATAASQSNALVAVISYTSPNVQIIDASNLSTDLTSNTVIATFTAPVTQKVTFNNITCMICAAVVNPLTNQLLLSTAQGYYAMDMIKGTFTALTFTPAALPAPNFSINPVATNPYVLSAVPGASELQMLNLNANTTTAVSSGLTAPGAVAIDLPFSFAAVVDADVPNQSLFTLADPTNPQFTLVSNIGVCGVPATQNMVAVGVSANATVGLSAHTLFTSQILGNCAGFQVWPTLASNSLNLQDIFYGYGPMPATPDGVAFLNGNDPNSIGTFNSVVDKKNYGLLIDANQQWIAKINFNNVFGDSIFQSFLPAGFAIPPENFCAVLGSNCTTPLPVVYLPAPSTAVTLSVPNISFGTVTVGTLSALVPVTVTNIGTATLNNSISVQGPNAGDFSLTTNCVDTIQPRSGCAVNVAFTPSATGARSATLVISAASPQTVALTGTGQ